MNKGRALGATVAFALVLALFGSGFLLSFGPTAQATAQECQPKQVDPVVATGTKSEQQRANATTIANVGASLGVPREGQVIAIATAMVEAGLLNVNYGDRDSLGLFQQRPSQGWGTPAQVTDPTYAATQFYTRLVKVPNWQSIDPGVAAQSVQRSAFPSRYGEKMQEATALYNSLGSSIQPVVGNVDAGVDPCQDTGPIAIDFGNGGGSFKDGPAQAYPRANPRTLAQM